MRTRTASGKAIIVDPVDQAAKSAEVDKRRADHAARTINGGCVADLGKLARRGFRVLAGARDPAACAPFDGE